MRATEKNPNRKAFPKFLLWVLGGGAVGFCVGLASGVLKDLEVGAWVSARLPALLGAIAPWGIPVSSAVLLSICFGYYRAAKKLCDRWDGEDDDIPDQVDRKLNVVLLCSSLAMILGFLFLAFMARLCRAQPSLFSCLARPTARLSAGTFRVTVVPAAM